MKLEELNHWWTEKSVDPELAPQTRRDLYGRLRGELGRRQVQVLVGLRRVGKSTILFQLADELIRSGENPLHILYCSFDEPELQGKRIGDILEEYSRLTGVDHRKERIYLMLDEVQKSKDWVADVKLLYDNRRNVKILASGSASLNVLAEARRSLAGRAIYYELRPLSFGEFLRFRRIHVDEERISLYEDQLKREFDRFLFRPFPELVNEDDLVFIKKYIRNSVIEPIILKDIPKEFGEADVLLLEKLVTIFLSNPGQYLSLDEIAKELRRAKATLYRALFYLEFSLLVRRVMNYRPSIRAASRKMSRIYAYHPCLTLPFDVPEEKYVENLVLFELDAKHYWRDKEKEVDFLSDLTPVEVKYGSRVGRDDVKHLSYFMNKYAKFGVGNGYVITRDAEGEIGGIRLVPLWKFCLTGLPVPAPR